MEDSANVEETEIPIPLNTSFAHLLPNSSIITTNHNNGSSNYKRSSSSLGIRYKECLKNHAANMGGNATDGCGEFMPSGEEGSIEALTCSACLCHRNFHRKENEGSTWFPHLNTKFLHHPTIISSRPAAIPQQMIMPYHLGPSMPSESDVEQEPPHLNHHHHNNNHQMIVRKRYRTKFTGEQKEKMLNFAEKVGWKIQKQEESFVQQFCQEIGVKRRVLKVWMHNNKHNLAKKSTTTIATTTITTTATNASLV